MENIENCYLRALIFLNQQNIKLLLVNGNITKD
jgi:hypothetical protein